MLARRTFLSAFTGLAALMISPCVFSRSDSHRWSEEAIRLGRPIAEPLVDHPFVRGMADGTLPKAAALRYLSQNLPYLENYAACFEKLEQRLKSPKDRALARRWIDETRATADWTTQLWQRIADAPSGPKLPIAPAAGVQRYMLLERSAVEDPSPAVAMAALLPCFWVYDVVGRSIAAHRKLDGNPYAEWAAYGSPEYGETVAAAIDLQDRLADSENDAVRQRALDVFLEACRMEKAFFDEAVGIKPME